MLNPAVHRIRSGSPHVGAPTAGNGIPTSGPPLMAAPTSMNDERLLFHSRLYFVFFAQHVVLVDVLRVQEGFGEVT